jgi:heme-degrading monooxygenase HmoA
MHFIAIWRFVVKPTMTDDFVRAYGADGVWSQLFAKGDGFISTHLLCKASDARTFITIDTWESLPAHRAFRTKFADEYAATDLLCANLTESEEKLAEGESCDPDTSRPAGALPA